MIDFSKKLGKKGVTKSLDPAVIYEGLDRSVDKGPLRPVQTAILKEWHENRRSERDVILKLHTGQGKTLIGLLLLQSKLNEQKGPALYLCPNIFLANQTKSQARQFGVPFCTDEGDLPQDFHDGRQILITHVQKLFNGQTKFKTGPRATIVNSLVLDDAHACVDAIRDACVIRVERRNQAYRDLLELFATSLELQGAGTLSDIRAGNFDALLPVPYWAWHDKQNEIVSILSKLSQRPANRNEQPHNAWFTWPLIKDNLHHCQCFVSGQAIEISPHLPPLDVFGSYWNAAHRVFMSATVANDSFLVKGLRISSQTLDNPLTYKDERWSGEKMVLCRLSSTPPLIGTRS